MTIQTASAPRDRVIAPAAPETGLGDRGTALEELVTFLQGDFEEKSSVVARKLHDEIGGSVIGAIDLARVMVEELRPTLLDSVGLFAALSWQFRRGCANARIEYQETYPESA